MSRKNLLKGLMGDEPVQRLNPDPPKRKGAIGAVSQSIDTLRQRSVIEVDPGKITASGKADRLGETDISDLVDSIGTYGQQVPVLLRPHPKSPDHYEVVFGRRRVAALRQLGQPVKAMVRNLDDTEAVLAQGQENTARKDLSFIEKSFFAKQLRDDGYERKIICAALNVDKTVISRMLQVADQIPGAVIHAIGPAPGIGRDRWLRLAELLTAEDPRHGDDVYARHATGRTSDMRFNTLLRALTPDKPRPKTWHFEIKGRSVGTYKRGQKSGVLSLNQLDFADWLSDNLGRFHQEFEETQDGASPQATTKKEQ